MGRPLARLPTSMLGEYITGCIQPDKPSRGYPAVKYFAPKFGVDGNSSMLSAGDAAVEACYRRRPVAS